LNSRGNFPYARADFQGSAPAAGRIGYLRRWQGLIIANGMAQPL